MAHKGYTINYFLDFFKAIPRRLWTEGTQYEATGQMCALGHAGSVNRLKNKAVNLGTSSIIEGAPAKQRAEALEHFLGGETAAINDGDGDSYQSLGATPRARILKALSNRKKYGSVFPNNDD